MRRLLIAVLISTVAAFAQNVGGITQAAAGGGGSGTVTNVATTGPITGGPITTTGTVACPTCTTAAAALTSGQLLLGAAGQALGIGNLSGDVSTAGGAVTTLATVNAGPGACGDATHICVPTTNGKGLVTSQTTITVGNSTTATALASVPTGCTGQFATGIAANGNATCSSTLEADISAPFITQFSTNSTSPKLTFQKARGTSGSPVAIAANDQVMAFEGDGYNGSTYTDYAQIFFTATSISPAAGQMIFRTANSTTGAITQAIIVDSSQNAGIAGTVSVGHGTSTAASNIGLDVFGFQKNEVLATPAAPVITNGGTTGSTTYTYAIIAKHSDGAHSAASATGSTSTGNATLTAGNFNTVTWSSVTGASCYDVYMTVPANHVVSLCNTGTSYNDVGTTVNNNVPLTTNNSGVVQVGGYLKTGVSTNTDLAGKITLSSGAGTYTFTGLYATAPVCVATDSTATNAVKASTTTTVLTLAGTTTDVINYICVGLN